MEGEIVDTLKDIVSKINRYLGIDSYQVNITEGIHVDYNCLGGTQLLYNAYKNTLNSRIYKYKDTYWNFTGPHNVNISVADFCHHITFDIGIYVFDHLQSYFEFLPTELLVIISSYLGLVDINTFCVYIRTWINLCDEKTYQLLYRVKFGNYLQLISPYLMYEQNTWKNRYDALLWEETATISGLLRKYRNLTPRSPHILFILLIADFLMNPSINIGNIMELYKKNPKFLKSLVLDLHPDKYEKIMNSLRKPELLNIRDFLKG